MSTTQIIIFKYCPLPFLYTPAFSSLFPSPFSLYFLTTLLPHLSLTSSSSFSNLAFISL